MAVYLGSKAVSVYNGGQMAPEEKTVTAGTSPIEVNATSGKLMSKVTVNPTPTEEKTVTPTTENLIVAPVEGKQLSQVTVQGDANFLEENIAEGVTMWGKTGTHQGGGVSGQYVWSKQYAGSNYTYESKSSIYTLTNDSIESVDIEYSTTAPVYNIETKKWDMADSTIITLINTDNFIPNIIAQEVYIRMNSEPNIWYLYREKDPGCPFSVGSASSNNTYTKTFTYSNKYTADIDSSYIEYVTGETEADYPDGGWKDGFWYVLKLAPIPTYLSFIGNEDFTLKTLDTHKGWDGMLEYSTDKSTWNTWNGTEISSAGSKLYLRGTGNTKITGNSTNYKFVFTGTDALKIDCEGNIENLLDYETVSAGGHPTMVTGCYGYMFHGCTSLTTAPELPATTLAFGCYGNMFNGCTSLTTAPELPATTLVTGCYAYMFYGCTSLTSAPSLPATTLDVRCYAYMFYGCTSLTSAPALPATTLAGNCYRYMFNRCTKIKLSTTQTGEYQTTYRIPKSGTGTTATDALIDMFKDTGGTFTGTPSINTTYYLSTSNIVV